MQWKHLPIDSNQYFMNKVILFGGTGMLGKRIAAALHAAGYATTAVVRNENKKELLTPLVKECIVAEVTDPAQLKGICAGFDIVVSSLGKPVSPNEKSRPSFFDIDFDANSRILEEALRAGVQKFVYVSVFHAAQYPALNYFRAHFLFEEKLKHSGIDYSIVRPPALFSAFTDLAEMAKKGRLMHMGRGDKRTNPIFEGDLAALCVASIHASNSIVEAGGPEIFTRREINQLIQDTVAPGKKIRTVPIPLIRSMLPLIRLFNRNLFDKLAFFLAVMEEDIVAPKMGKTRLADYLEGKEAGDPPSTAF